MWSLTVIALCLYWAATTLWGLISWAYWRRLDWDFIISRLENEEEREAAVAFQRVESMEAKAFTKCLPGILFLFPIRLAVMSVLTLPHIIPFHIVGRIYPPPSDITSNEFNATSQWLLLGVSSVLVRVGMWLMGVVRIREHYLGGREPIVDRKQIKHIIVSNHVSSIDVLFLMQRLLPSFVAKIGVANAPVVGLCSKLMGCVYVDRSSNGDRDRVLNLLQQRQAALAEQAASSSTKDPTVSVPPLVIFPEGTTSSGRMILPFKRGAFWSLRPVTPMVLIYRCSGFNVSFETVPFGVWLALIYSSVGTTSLDVYWLPDQSPDPPKTDLSHEEKVARFGAKVRDKMQAVLNEHQHWKPSARLLDTKVPNDWDALMLKFKILGQLKSLKMKHP